MFVSLCLTLPVIQRNLRMVEINKYYYYYYYYSNSRSKGDTLGKFTFHPINGISTVDYIIVSHDLFTWVKVSP